jgi:hypothetical protein
VTVEDGKQMMVKQYHSILGNVNRSQTLETSKKFGWKIKDFNEAFTCVGCQIEKATRWDKSKESRNKSTLPGERLMLDIIYARQYDGTQTDKY